METRSESRELSSPPAISSLSSTVESPAAWWRIFGPGAVIASLTIGSGELIFASRGGALFGYRLLWYFAVVLLLKWVLLYGSARHMVLTGAHPLERSMNLPGPRGWFPLTLILLAAVCFPVWVFFHSGTLGTLLAWLSNTRTALSGSAPYLWGLAILLGTLVLALTKGYATLERIQLGIVFLMIGGVLVSLFLLQPDWVAMLKGLLIPQWLAYPDWVEPSRYPEIAARPVWVEAITYVGVVGGSSYDYLAYVSYLREKKWGRAGRPVASRAELDRTDLGSARAWLRAPLIDCTLSFLAVLIFSAGFLACGALVLGTQQKVPDGADLLNLQAEFVTPLFSGLQWVYFAGAFLAMFGTLYGTIEVGPAIVKELRHAFERGETGNSQLQHRRIAILWSGTGAGLLLVTATWLLMSGTAKQIPGLITLLIPANLFTGVLGCGLVCCLNLWMDRKYLPSPLRMRPTLAALTLVAGVLLIAFGFKAYWDVGGWWSFLILLGTCSMGWFIARGLRHSRF